MTNVKKIVESRWVEDEDTFTNALSLLLSYVVYCICHKLLTAPKFLLDFCTNFSEDEQISQPVLNKWEDSIEGLTSDATHSSNCSGAFLLLLQYKLICDIFDIWPQDECTAQRRSVKFIRNELKIWRILVFVISSSDIPQPSHVPSMQQTKSLAVIARHKPPSHFVRPECQIEIWSQVWVLLGKHLQKITTYLWSANTCHILVADRVGWCCSRRWIGRHGRTSDLHKCQLLAWTESSTTIPIADNTFQPLKPLGKLVE